MTEERLDWIESWAKGWKEIFDRNPLSPCDDNYYSRLPTEVAIGMVLELTAAMKDSE